MALKMYDYCLYSKGVDRILALHIQKENSKMLENRKKLTILSITFLLFLINPMMVSATGALAKPTNAEQTGESKNELNKASQPQEFYLIIQSAPKANIEKNDVSKPGTFKLTLHDVSPYAIAFTQRPIRKVELITLDQLLKLWNNSDPNGFTINPPNAAVNAFIEDSGSQEHLNFFVQLLEPKYNAQKRTLTYVVNPLEGNPTAMPDSATLGHVNLFIDDICLNCWWPK